jgi:hypothetical protein
MGWEKPGRAVDSTAIPGSSRVRRSGNLHDNPGASLAVGETARIVGGNDPHQIEPSGQRFQVFGQVRYEESNRYAKNGAGGRRFAVTAFGARGNFFGKSMFANIKRPILL